MFLCYTKTFFIHKENVSVNQSTLKTVTYMKSKTVDSTSPIWLYNYSNLMYNF